MRKRIISLLLLLLVLVLVGWKNNELEVYEEKEYSMTEEILGTAITGKIIGINAEEALNKAFDRAREIEAIMSVKNEDSEISYLNKNGYKSEIKVSNELFYVIEKGIYYGELTEGAFDITIGNLIDLWGIGTENERLPDNEEISQYISLENYKNIKLNKENKSIRFLKENIKLDLGAIAKGYIADEMKRVLIDEYNINCGILNLGGNVLTIGVKSDNTLWNVGICDPFNTADIVGTIESSNETIVTSGNYEKYFVKDEIRYHHILNPKTGYPAEEGYISTTIVTENSIDADALSTATYVLGVNKAKELLESLEGVEGIFIDEDGKIITTLGIESRIKVIKNDS